MHSFFLVLHVLAATVWTGGHLILAIVVLPKILKTKNIQALTEFEENFEKIGIPALIIQVITGIYLAYSLLPNVSEWFSFSNHVSTHVGIKLILLIITVLLALDARFRLIPNLSEKNSISLAVHIFMVTLVAILFVITGLSFRLAII
ncbi:MAG: CopD family protein [Bacteroidetes bacterium]|nr:CopD family protein [Bacteroidota bacterium]